MFSHVMIGTNDLEKAKAFYDALLGTLDVRPAKVDGHRIFYFTKTGVFSVSKPINGQPATHANGGTIGFAAEFARAGRRVARGGHRQWRQDLRKSAGHSRRLRRAKCISLICAISTATRSARCTGWQRRARRVG